MTLGGRAAEEIIFGKISTGAQNDLERITKTAYSMVTVYGMNERVGQLSFYDANSEHSFQKPYSDATAKIIDEEVKKIIDEAYERTKALLNERASELEVIAQELLKKEVIFQNDLIELIGKRPFEEKTTYDEFVNHIDVTQEETSGDEEKPVVEEKKEEQPPKKNLSEEQS